MIVVKTESTIQLNCKYKKTMKWECTSIPGNINNACFCIGTSRSGYIIGRTETDYFIKSIIL